MNAFSEIHEHVNSIWVVDTHEHMVTEAEWLAVDESRLDFSQLMHYIDLDVVSAGMPFEQMQTVRFADVGEDEKWAIFEPHWRGARNTTFAKAIEWTVRDFYSLPGLNRDTYKEVGRRIRETRKPGRYRHILKNIARIEVSLLDTQCTDVDRELFLPVPRLDHLLWFANRESIETQEKRQSVSLGSLADLEREIGTAIEGAKHAGAVAIKSAQSYLRTLHYEPVERESAARAFDGVAGEGADHADAKTLSDYLFYRLVEGCIEHGLPIQVHTGMNAGHAVRLEPTNPLHLTDAILHYPEAKFDLFHAGFPYWEEMGVMVKAYPNVRADMCWTHIVSPAAARRALDEWLDLAPANKIFAFGGDLGSPEIAATHLKIARENVAMVLAGKVDSGYFTVEDAKEVADMVLRENAREFFGLQPR